ncbi:MAG TPA: TIGR03557 family F420-dependent LLM class oxidoreductase [Ilumatobacteraceae bacterium]|nr:TIGR03557 family F420-dependent LLM class oxidoreductase [Ilumatobacteraceae bacterium]
MVEIGYALSSEEHGPKELLQHARLAEDAGIESVWISDHFHPWLDDQGQSPFVWSVIGAIAATTKLAVTTAVTCPTMRIHPAIIAQAAATSSLLLDGRFELGVGSGENLNEHILGDKWPPTEERLEMLDEAIEVMRLLWKGEEASHRGQYYTVEDARIYSLPETPPKILMSAFGPKSTELAARIADGYVTTHPSKESVQQYRDQGGRGTIDGAMKVCWGKDRDECAKLAHRLWRTSGLSGQLAQDLRTPAIFDQAAELVSVESMADDMPCGPDVEPIVAAAKEYVDAGFDRVYLTQVGPDQEEFFAFFTKELAPALKDVGLTPGRS